MAKKFLTISNNKPTANSILIEDVNNLTSELSGKQATIGYTPENQANKENTTIDTSTTKYPTVNLLKNGLDNKVDKNASIAAATKTKITYDAKGLVTAGADLSASDLPSFIDASKIANGAVSNTEFQYLDGVSSGIQTQLNGKSATTHNHNLSDLAEKSYDSLTGRPNLFSGSYLDLTNQPDIPPIVAFYTQSNLTISGNNGNFFLIEISADSSFTLSNIVTGTHYYFRIKNTGASTITITLPNTADIKASATTTISAGKHKELAMIYDGTNRNWQISEELT